MKTSNMLLWGGLAFLVWKSGILGGALGGVVSGAGNMLGGAAGATGGGGGSAAGELPTSGADIDLTPIVIGTKIPTTKNDPFKLADYGTPITSKTYRALQRSTGTAGVQVLTSYAKQRYPGLQNIPNISFNTARMAASGTLHESTYQSIMRYQAVKSGQMSAYDYAGGAAALPGVSRAGYDYAEAAFHNSPTYQLQQRVRQMNAERPAGTPGYVVRNGQIVSRGY